MFIIIYRYPFLQINKKRTVRTVMNLRIQKRFINFVKINNNRVMSINLIIKYKCLEETDGLDVCKNHVQGNRIW